MNGAMVSEQRVGFSVPLQKSRISELGLKRVVIALDCMVRMLVSVERIWEEDGEGDGASVMAWVDSKREERNTTAKRRFLSEPIVSDFLYLEKNDLL